LERSGIGYFKNLVIGAIIHFKGNQCTAHRNLQLVIVFIGRISFIALYFSFVCFAIVHLAAYFGGTQYETGCLHILYLKQSMLFFMATAFPLVTADLTHKKQSKKSFIYILYYLNKQHPTG